MYPKALRCVIVSGLPERRQKQLRRVETEHQIEQELPNKSTPSTYGVEI
jgi:hypothetical protein